MCSLFNSPVDSVEKNAHQMTQDLFYFCPQKVPPADRRIPDGNGTDVSVFIIKLSSLRDHVQLLRDRSSAFRVLEVEDAEVLFNVSLIQMLRH